MILDALLTFTGSGNGATGGIVLGQWVDAPTTGTQQASNIIDLGVIDGIPTSDRGGGARDMGIGDRPMLKLSAIATTAMVGGTSIQLQLEGAPDDGTGLPGAWTIMWTSPVILAAAMASDGVQLSNTDVPRTVPGQPLPRFLRLDFISVGTFTSGGIEAQIVIDRDDQIVGNITGTYSGYPAGINVMN